MEEIRKNGRKQGREDRRERAMKRTEQQQEKKEHHCFSPRLPKQQESTAPQSVDLGAAHLQHKLNRSRPCMASGQMKHLFTET